MTIQSLTAFLIPVLMGADAPGASPRCPDSYASSRWDAPALVYQIVDRQQLKDFRLDGMVDVEVRPIGPLGTRNWAYIVRVSPKDTTEIPTPAELTVWTSTPDDTMQTNRAPRERFQAVKKTLVHATRHGDRLEYRFELQAALAPVSTLDLAIREDLISLLLRGFPALAPE